jgi:DNA repair exonuclease SbcCD nuclease subunit
MKIAMITDTHWGVRGDNISFLNNNKHFLDNIFFPYLANNNIKTVLHLGDLVDRRKYININTAKSLREDFLDPLFHNDYDVHIIAGNHDTYFKNTNETNSLRELVGMYPFKLYDKHSEVVRFDNLDMLLIPWICDDNKKQIFSSLSSSSASVSAGHLELSGFEMYKGSMVSHGFDRSLFSRFDTVFSGHYHHRSSDGSIFYLGSHGEFTWSDYNDPRGFHVFDTETRKVEFIENPYRMFKKFWYNDTVENFEWDLDYSEYNNCMVKVIVQNKSNLFLFDKVISGIEENTPLDIQIVEDHMNLGLEDDNDIVNEAESTLDIFKKYIGNIEDKNIDRNKLESKIIELYHEANSL